MLKMEIIPLHWKHILPNWTKKIKMAQVILTTSFKKKASYFLKLHPSMKEKYKKTLLLLQANPSHPYLRLHKLKGILFVTLKGWGKTKGIFIKVQFWDTPVFTSVIILTVKKKWHNYLLVA